MHRGVGHTVGFRGRAVQHGMGLMGYLEEEGMGGEAQGTDFGDLGRNKCGKWRVKGIKKGWLHVSSWLVSTLVWLCAAPDQHSLSYFLIKLLSNSFLGESSLLDVCVSVHGGGGNVGGI